MKDHDVCPHQVCYSSFVLKRCVIDTYVIIRTYLTLNWKIYLWSPLLLLMSNCWEILKTEFSHLQACGCSVLENRLWPQGRQKLGLQWWQACSMVSGWWRHKKVGKACSRVGSEAKVTPDAFSFCRHWILRDLVNDNLSSLTFPKHVMLFQNLSLHSKGFRRKKHKRRQKD